MNDIEWNRLLHQQEKKYDKLLLVCSVYFLSIFLFGFEIITGMKLNVYFRMLVLIMCGCSFLLFYAVPFKYKKVAQMTILNILWALTMPIAYQLGTVPVVISAVLLFVIDYLLFYTIRAIDRISGYFSIKGERERFTEEQAQILRFAHTLEGMRKEDRELIIEFTETVLRRNTTKKTTDLKPKP